MKVLITGKGGQLAWELERLAPDDVDVVCFSRSALDISNEKNVSVVIENEQPDLVINAAAYTAVDRAEQEAELAHKVNELGVKYLAQQCKKIGARLLHISTDFIFDGARSTPYQTDSQPNPLNAYGASKLAGEVALKKILPDNSVIVRTAWVYSSTGNNFVKSMLRLMEEKAQLGVVCDQIGTPTWAKGLAQWLWVLAKQPEIKGTYHWTDAGVASWYDFAVAIQELGVEKGLLKKVIPIVAIPTSAYPTVSKRPHFSLLDKSYLEQLQKLKIQHWRKQLSSMMDEL